MVWERKGRQGNERGGGERKGRQGKGSTVLSLLYQCTQPYFVQYCQDLDLSTVAGSMARSQQHSRGDLRRAPLRERKTPV